MKHKIISIITAVVATIGFSFAFSLPTFAEDICSNTAIPEEVRAASGCQGLNVEVPELDSAIINIVNGVIAFLGVVAVIVVVIGGVQYMTSSGDPGKAKRAKDTILYAAIGLIISVLAFSIVNFVIVNIIGGQRGDTDSEEETGYIVNDYTA